MSHRETACRVVVNETPSTLEDDVNEELDRLGEEGTQVRDVKLTYAGQKMIVLILFDLLIED